jgi:hypothetical protein
MGILSRKGTAAKAAPDGSSRRTKSQIESATERPKVHRVKKVGIPKWLRRLARWVCWSYVWRVNKKGEGKWTKVPIDPKTGTKASANQPATWGTFKQAYDFYSDHKDDDDDRRIDGIGVEFYRKGSPQDPDLAGVDLDDAIDPRTGKVKKWARRVIKKLNSYTELSPSATGFKVYVLSADIFHGTDKQGSKLPYHDGELELYVGGRFFCVTGHHLAGTPATVEDRSGEMKEVLDWLTEHQRKEEPKPESKPESKSKVKSSTPTPSANGHHDSIRGDLNLFLAKLDGVKATGNGQYTACCPAHPDASPSLSVGQGADGRNLVKCHADSKCTAQSIVTAMSLTLSDLFQPNRNGRREPFKPEPRKPTGKSYPTAKEALASLDWVMQKQQGQRVGKWRYRDSQGKLVALVVRYDLDTPKGEKQQKTFRPVSRWEDGWHCCDPETWPLYNLNDLAGAEVVFVCEGEKCCDALTALGMTATTSAHGSQSPRKTDWGPLAGKQVVLAPDDDDAGDQYVAAVTEILSQLSPQPSITIGKPLFSKE